MYRAWAWSAYKTDTLKPLQMTAVIALLMDGQQKVPKAQKNTHNYMKYKEKVEITNVVSTG